MKKHNQITLKILCFLFVLSFIPVSNIVGHYPSVPVQAATEMKINRTKATLTKGKTLQLKISGTSEKITWTSSNKKIATVSSSGKVTAKAKGTAIITATVGSETFTCKITVETPSITNSEATLIKGQTLQLGINGTVKKITWSSSNNSIASITSSGKVTAKKKGTATITATVNGVAYTCDITVETPKINVSSLSLVIDKTYQLYINGTDQEIIWTSSNQKVASVSSNGKVTALTEGTTTIKAKIGTKTYKCVVEVTSILSVNKTAIEIEEEGSIEVTFKPTSQQTVSFQIDNPDIISCSWDKKEWVDDCKKIYITGKAKGTTYITITNTENSEKIVIEVTVNKKDPISIELPKTPITLHEYSYSNKLEQTYIITNIRYEFKEHSYNNTITVDLYFDGYKTYDYRGSGQSSRAMIGWKLYDEEDYVIDSGTCYAPGVSEGDKFKDAYEYISGLKKGNYRLELLSVN